MLEKDAEATKAHSTEWDNAQTPVAHLYRNSRSK